MTAWPSGPGWAWPAPGAGENSSGDIFLAFATGNRGLAGGELTVPPPMLAGERIDPLFYAVIEATEEAIVNAMVAAETMTGRGGHRPPPRPPRPAGRDHGPLPATGRTVSPTACMLVGRVQHGGAAGQAGSNASPS